MIGKRLGHYEISDQLGKGGMGEVYRARDTKLGREVAIKVLPSEFSQDEERLARLEREARMLASLNHPNIAAIYGLEQSEDTSFLVLELVEGDTLADRLKEGAIPVEESLKLALQIAEALEAAHENGVIHRDLKPANIKVTPEGRVKVLDFGLAKAFIGEQADVNLSNSPTLSMAATQQGLVLGTAGYMSPEQANGEIADRRADIWSFGVVLFEMLTGRPLFTGKTVSYILADVLRSEPDWTELPANLHPRVRVILERALEKEAKDRLSGISDARVEIQKALGDPRGVQAGATPADLQTEAPKRLPWVAAVAVGIVLAAVITWNVKPSDPPGPVTRFDFDIPVGVGFRNTARNVLAASPDGRLFVYNTLDGLYLRSFDELEARLIPGTENSSLNPFFSPDSQWIGFWNISERQLEKIAISGGTPILISPTAGPPFGISWGVDDNVLYAQSDGIYRVSANGGTPERIIDSGQGEQFDGPQLLPDGAGILFTVGNVGEWDDGDIVVQSLHAPQDRKVVWSGSDGRYLSSGHLTYALGDDLFAIAFDLDRLEVAGTAVSLEQGLGRATTSASANYGVSDNGSLVYLFQPVDAQEPRTLAWVDRNGLTERLDLPSDFYLHPRISPDGRRLAVQTTQPDGASDIWVYNLDGTTQRQRLAGPGNKSRPIWTHDSARLTFASDRDGTLSIWWQAADGSSPAEQLTEAEEGGLPHWPDSWSPDGTLAFTQYVTGEQHVWTLSLDEGAEPGMIAGGLGTEQAGGADFSPDGRWIAYRSNQGNSRIQIQPFPPDGAIYDIALEGGSYPMWSRDGTQLFYRPPTGGATQSALMVLNVTIEGNSPRFTDEQVLPIDNMLAFFGYRDYDVSLDGQRLLVILPEERSESVGPLQPRVITVLNWLEELTERVPVR